MDSQDLTKTVGEVSKAATKFQEIMLKIFSPHLTCKQADADAYADERKLQMIRENPDMEIVYVDGKINVREYSPEALAARAQQREISDSIRQERNLENTLKITGEEVQNALDVSDEPVDEDWIARFFQIVKDVSSEEMQVVWGKILAGEIKQPGTFSLRALERIRDISKKDAELFMKILPCIVGYGNVHFIPSDTEIMKKHGIAYSDILALDECGLVNSSGMLRMNVTISKDKKVGVYTNKHVIIIQGTASEEKTISVGIYTLTRTGCELFNILEQIGNDEYVLELAASIYNANKAQSIIVTVHEVNHINNGDINYNLTPVAEYKGETQSPSAFS